MWELDYKESWVPKNWCFWTVLLDKIFESPLNCKEIQPVHPKGSQSWIFIGRTDVEAETAILWPPDAKNWLIRKDPDAGKDWSWEKKRTTENEAVGWHDRLDGHKCGQAPGVGWWTGRPGVLQSMGLQRVGHNWATELNWTERLVLDRDFVENAMCLVTQSCPTLCDPMDCSPPGCSVHGDSPGKDTGVSCHALLQGIFPIQGLNPGLLHCRQILYQLSHQRTNLYSYKKWKFNQTIKFKR